MIQDNECLKCDGKGYFDAFRHIQNGTCYACGGTGKGSVKTKCPTNTVPASTSKTKTVTINKEVCSVSPFGSMLQIIGDTGMILIDWESAKAGNLNVVAIGDGWRRIEKRVIKELQSQLKPIKA